MQNRTCSDTHFQVEHAIDATLSMGWGGVGMLTFAWSWTRYWCTGLHAQWSLKLAKQKKVRISCGRVAKRKKNDLFFKGFLLWDGYETLKGLSFFDHGDAPTRAIPHPAGCFCCHTSQKDQFWDRNQTETNNATGRSCEWHPGKSWYHSQMRMRSQTFSASKGTMVKVWRQNTKILNP